MHEMSVALSIVDQVEQAARSRSARGVRRVRLDIGELAGVVPDALAFCFELACSGAGSPGRRTRHRVRARPGVVRAVQADLGHRDART
ncbi:Hydrogenase maturation factor HypA [Streptomyces hirsutus]